MHVHGDVCVYVHVCACVCARAGAPLQPGRVHTRGVGEQLLPMKQTITCVCVRERGDEREGCGISRDDVIIYLCMS